MRTRSSFSGPLIGGLHRKVSTALLCLALLLVSATGFLSQHIFSTQSAALGRSLAITEVQLLRERLLRLIGRELVMVQRFAELSSGRLWLETPDSSEAQARFFADAEGFRQALTDQLYFAVPARTHAYYQADAQTSPLALPERTVDATRPEDSWYARALDQPYALDFVPGAEPGPVLRISVPVHDNQAHPVGVVGTTMGLERFLSAMVSQGADKAVHFLLRADGQFLAHPDPRFQTHAPGTPDQPNPTLFMVLKNPDHARELSHVLDLTRKNPGSVELMALDTLDGPRLMAISHIPELKITAGSSIDVSLTSYIASDSLRLAMALTVVGLFILIGVMSYQFERLVLHPLMDMADTARHLFQGKTDLNDYSSRSDEIGELAQALERAARINTMRVTELEQRLEEARRQAERNTARKAEKKSQTENPDISLLP